MKKLLATVTMLASSLYLAAPVFAAESFSLCSGGFGSTLCNLTLSGVVKTGIQAILIVALVLAFIFLVIGGIRWILSGGDKAGTEAAKGTITAALIGLVIVFLAWAFLKVVTTFFGVGGPTNSFDLPTVGGSGAGSVGAGGL